MNTGTRARNSDCEHRQGVQELNASKEHMIWITDTSGALAGKAGREHVLRTLQIQSGNTVEDTDTDMQAKTCLPEHQMLDLQTPTAETY